MDKRQTRNTSINENDGNMLRTSIHSLKENQTKLNETSDSRETTAWQIAEEPFEGETFDMSMRRYLLLTIFCSIACANQISFSLSNTASPDYLFYFALIFFLPFFSSSINLIENWGLKTTLMIACALQALGLLLGAQIRA